MANKQQTQHIDLNDDDAEEEEYQHQNHRSPFHVQSSPSAANNQPQNQQAAPKNENILQSIREVLEVLDFQNVGFHLYFVAERDAERLRHVAEANQIVLLEPARRFNMPSNNFNSSNNVAAAQEHYFAQQHAVPFEQQHMPQQQIHHSNVMVMQPQQQLPASSQPMLMSPQHHLQPQMQVHPHEPPQWSYGVQPHLVSHRIVPRERKPPKMDKLEKAQNRVQKQQKKKEGKLAAQQAPAVQEEKKKKRRKQKPKLQQDPAAWNKLQQALGKAHASDQNHNVEPQQGDVNTLSGNATTSSIPQEQQQSVPVDATSK